MTEKIKVETLTSLIKPGSVDKLAALAIPKLGEIGTQITTLEGPATFAEIINSLAIEGSGNIITKGDIFPNLDDQFYSMFDMQTSYQRPNEIIDALSIYALSDRENSIALVTSGSFTDGDHTVQIGLNASNRKGGNPPRSISITENDIARLGILKSSPDILKQFVADQALRFLLDELGIEHKNIPFEPRIIEKKLLEDKNATLLDLNRLLKNSDYLLAFAESASAGFIASSFTDIPGSEKMFSTGKVLYNSKEKIAARVRASSLTKDNLYSKLTAYELANTVYVQKGNIIAIGITGLLDTPDTRPEFVDKKTGDVYYSIIVPGLGPITEKVSLKQPASRIDMKAELMLIITKHLNQILRDANKYSI